MIQAWTLWSQELVSFFFHPQRLLRCLVQAERKVLVSLRASTGNLYGAVAIVSYISPWPLHRLLDCGKIGHEYQTMGRVYIEMSHQEKLCSFLPSSFVLQLNQDLAHLVESYAVLCDAGDEIIDKKKQVWPHINLPQPCIGRHGIHCLWCGIREVIGALHVTHHYIHNDRTAGTRALPGSQHSFDTWEYENKSPRIVLSNVCWLLETKQQDFDLDVFF